MAKVRWSTVTVNCLEHVQQAPHVFFSAFSQLAERQLDHDALYQLHQGQAGALFEVGISLSAQVIQVVSVCVGVRLDRFDLYVADATFFEGLSS